TVADFTFTGYVGTASDTVTIGSKSPSTGGKLVNVQGKVTVIGGGGPVTVTADDSGDTSSRIVTVTDSGGAATVTGLAPSTLIVKKQGAGLPSLVLNGGGAGNTFDVAGIPAGIGVTINAGAGKDHVNVGNGTALHRLDGVVGPLTVNGQNGGDDLNLLDY